MSCRYIVGDSLTVLHSLPDASVDLVLSSPPFLALRSYLPANHPDKASEIGSEATPGVYIDVLLDIVEECRRVLAPHGSLCFELGDTYAGSGGAGGDYAENGLREGQERFDGSGRRRRLRGEGRDWPQTPGANWKGEREGWPLDKSLTLIPELLRLSLAYGFNPLTGRQTPRWRVRNVVRWCRPNPPVGALADKVRPATSDIVVACTSRKRYFDLDAVRTPMAESTAGRAVNNRRNPGTKSALSPTPPLDHWWFDDVFDQDAWRISTEPYKGSHYATWPSDLCVIPIESMCPRRVCRTCGEPSRRLVDARRIAPADNGTRRKNSAAANPRSGFTETVPEIGWEYERTTTDWSSCGHGDWRPGVVFDPFAGSGTTLAVAHGHGRDAIGIDLDERNAELALQRVGMWLTVEHFADSLPVSREAASEGAEK